MLCWRVTTTGGRAGSRRHSMREGVTRRRSQDGGHTIVTTFTVQVTNMRHEPQLRKATRRGITGCSQHANIDLSTACNHTVRRSHCGHHDENATPDTTCLVGAQSSIQSRVAKTLGTLGIRAPLQQQCSYKSWSSAYFFNNAW